MINKINIYLDRIPLIHTRNELESILNNRFSFTNIKIGEEGAIDGNS
jgi:hypothetical protein